MVKVVGVIPVDFDWNSTERKMMFWIGLNFSKFRVYLPRFGHPRHGPPQHPYRRKHKKLERPQGATNLGSEHRHVSRVPTRCLAEEPCAQTFMMQNNSSPQFLFQILLFQTSISTPKSLDMISDGHDACPRKFKKMKGSTCPRYCHDITTMSSLLSPTYSDGSQAW